MAKAPVSSFEAVTRLTKVPTLVGGSLGKRMAVGRVSLRACNKTLTGCEPLLFVASFEWRYSTYSACAHHRIRSSQLEGARSSRIS
jgi:hypothetical protein